MRDSGAGITHVLPQIMGVDGAGEIAQINASGSKLTVGQDVVLHPGIACRRCEYCLSGETVLCTSIRFLGEHRDGTLAEYVSLPAQHVFPMPPGLNYGEAAALGVNHLTAWRMVVGQAVWADALKSLARGGRLAVCGATSGSAPSADLQRLFVRQLQLFGSSLGTLEEFRLMLEFIRNTGIRPVIDRVFDMADIHAALDFLESGKQFGKVAVSIKA